MKILALLLSFAAAFPVLAQSSKPKAAEIVASYRKHPRLLARAEDFRRLHDLIVAEPAVAEWAKSIRAEADRLLEAPPSEYAIPDGKRLLATSRQVLERATTLGLYFRLSEDRRYAERLWRELEAAAKFKDWNPSHFLDTAEMTAAFAIGYDWLHAEWTPAQRATLRQAIVDKGLTPSLAIYRKDKGWAASEHNWNQVCNGGMTLGALAVIQDSPALAGEILERAIATVPRAMKHFAPDGAWGEGPGYWDYAAKYNVLMLAALDSAFGKDFGLSQIPGFEKAGDFPIHTTGPLGRSFNYADAGEGAAGGSHLLWLATKFKRPDWAAWRIARVNGGVGIGKNRPLAKPDALDFLWGAEWLAQKPSIGDLPNARHFRGADVVTMRSAWNDPEATFVGFKGGDNKVNHGHLDLGSFVLDADGRRWASDLGADNYNLPGYFGKNRWDFYRCRAEGQNTLVINPDAEPDQDPRAVAPITRFASSDTRHFAIADLSAGYAKSATRVHRGIEMRGRVVLVQDEIATREPSEVWWFMHTLADVSVDGVTATCTLDGRSLKVRILSPAGATFQVLPAEPLPASPRPAGQQQKGSPWTKMDMSKARKLAVKLNGVTDTTIAIAFLPEDASPAPELKPLAQW